MSLLRSSWEKAGLRVGLVPTMGALHEGHASLIRRARKENGRVVVSIFVNPAQFGPGEDFNRYPRAFAADRRLCAEAGADVIYHPSAEAVYLPGYRTVIEVQGLSDLLCGRWRPGHFKGVATVVLKLLETIRPGRAYFGEKDYQQLVIVKTMTRDLGLPCSIIGCPTVREKDGLALSSRNRYLSPRQRSWSVRLSAGLRQGAAAARGGASPRRVERVARREILKIPGVSIDYVSLVDSLTLAGAKRCAGSLRLLAAIRIGRTRLIDNFPVTCYTPRK
jgi:pantoate--beta-alanine ligase